jgi:hypothetical protein
MNETDITNRIKNLSYKDLLIVCVYTVMRLAWKLQSEANKDYHISNFPGLFALQCNKIIDEALLFYERSNILK